VAEAAAAEVNEPRTRERGVALTDKQSLWLARALFRRIKKGRDTAAGGDGGGGGGGSGGGGSGGGVAAVAE
jgi:uncharacterized membrane protein YgcG